MRARLAATAPSPRRSATRWCARGSSEFWGEAVRHLPAEGLDLDAYRAALLDRFDNARIQHLLDQIGQDGTTKLRVRIVPLLKAERAAGREGAASLRVLGAWVAAARGGRLPVDPRPGRRSPRPPPSRGSAPSRSRFCGSWITRSPTSRQSWLQWPERPPLFDRDQR